MLRVRGIPLIGNKNVSKCQCFKVSWFLGLSVSSLPRFFGSKFQSFKVPTIKKRLMLSDDVDPILQHYHFTFLEDIDPILKIFKYAFDGSLGIVGPRLFQHVQLFRCPAFSDFQT